MTATNGLNFGAYDLAEWTSLQPMVRQTAPYLWTTLMLRLPLGLIGILVTHYVASEARHKYVALLGVVFIAIALLPPLEFFTIYRDDPNYVQQFTIAILTVVLGTCFVLWWKKPRFQRLPALVSFIGCLLAILGLYQARTLLQGFDITVAFGPGGILTALSLAGVSILYITKQSS